MSWRDENTEDRLSPEDLELVVAKIREKYPEYGKIYPRPDWDGVHFKLPPD